MHACHNMHVVCCVVYRDNLEIEIYYRGGNSGYFWREFRVREKYFKWYGYGYGKKYLKWYGYGYGYGKTFWYGYGYGYGNLF